MNFLRYYMRFENTEMLAKFTNEITILTKRNITMGIEELLLDLAEKKGRKEGVEEGLNQKEFEKNRDFTRNLLSSTDFPVAKIAQLVGVNEDFVLKVKADLDK